MTEEVGISSILIVDDQPHLQQPFSQELMDEGYRVVSIGDAKSGMKYLADSKPDLVLLGLYLDGFEGSGLLADIKTRDPNLPVLIVTAYDTFVSDPRAFQADGYVVKSFLHFDELKRKIADMLARDPLNPT